MRVKRGNSIIYGSPLPLDDSVFWLICGGREIVKFCCSSGK